MFAANGVELPMGVVMDSIAFGKLQDRISFLQGLRESGVVAIGQSTTLECHRLWQSLVAHNLEKDATIYQPGQPSSLYLPAVDIADLSALYRSVVAHEVLEKILTDDGTWDDVVEAVELARGARDLPLPQLISAVARVLRVVGTLTVSMREEDDVVGLDDHIESSLDLFTLIGGLTNQGCVDA